MIAETDETHPTSVDAAAAGTILGRWREAAALLRRDLSSYPWRLAATRLVLALLPRMTCGWLRPGLYRWLGGLDVDPRSVFLGALTLEGSGAIGRNLHIGRGSMLTTPLYLNLSGVISIGEQVVIGHHVIIVTDTHDFTNPLRRGGPVHSLPVRIGNGAWLGARVTVLPGVTIGPGAVVAAGAVVNRDVPAHTLVAGVPARVVRVLAAEGPEPTANLAT